jgi:hypothetical protein
MKKKGQKLRIGQVFWNNKLLGPYITSLERNSWQLKKY